MLEAVRSVRTLSGYLQLDTVRDEQGRLSHCNPNGLQLEVSTRVGLSHKD